VGFRVPPEEPVIKNAVIQGRQMSLRNIGDEREAIKYYEYSLSHNPESSVYPKALRELDMSIVARLKKGQSIEDVAESLNNQQPENEDSSDKSGVYYRARGFYTRTGRESFLTTLWRRTRAEAEQDVRHYGRGYTNVRIVTITAQEHANRYHKLPRTS
jgi:tetratricopeptide (TPR) repeat protein